MKTQYLSKMIGSGIVALSLITLPVVAPVSAQTGTPNSTDSSRTSTYNKTAQTGTPNSTDSSRTSTYNRTDDSNNWSWLGLLGLLGLSGLLRPRHENSVRSRDDNSGMR